VNVCYATCVCAAVLFGFAARAGTTRPPADAIELAAACASCHRTDGGSSFIPVLSGMDENRILQRMAEFRRQTRGDQIMHVVANALTPQETAAIARYFATSAAPTVQP
jgi:sulfide dehydrogenase cytochrome subunit